MIEFITIEHAQLNLWSEKKTNNIVMACLYNNFSI